MHQPTPKGIAQRIITWWNSRTGQRDTASSSSPSGAQDKLASARRAATQIGGELRGATGEARIRGRSAIGNLQRRAQAGRAGSGPGGIRDSAVRLGRRAREATSARSRDDRSASATAMASSERNLTAANESTPPAPDITTSTGDSPPATGASSSSSAAWASTAGVTDTDLSSPGNVDGPRYDTVSPADQEAGFMSGERTSGDSGHSTARDRNMSFTEATPSHPLLGAATDDGSSIAEIERDQAESDQGSQSTATTLSADAYRSTAAPEQMGPADDERSIGSGVTMNEPTGQIPGSSEPVPDPVAGQPGTGADTRRRGGAGLGTGVSGTVPGSGSLDDVDVADVAADDTPSTDTGSSDALTRQDAAGAVDTSDPDGISRSIVRDAAQGGKPGEPGDAPPAGTGADRPRSRS